MALTKISLVGVKLYMSLDENNFRRWFIFDQLPFFGETTNIVSVFVEKSKTNWYENRTSWFCVFYSATVDVAPDL